MLDQFIMIFIDYHITVSSVLLFPLNLLMHCSLLSLKIMARFSLIITAQMYVYPYTYLPKCNLLRLHKISSTKTFNDFLFFWVLYNGNNLVGQWGLYAHLTQIYSSLRIYFLSVNYIKQEQFCGFTSVIKNGHNCSKMVYMSKTIHKETHKALMGFFSDCSEAFFQSMQYQQS